LNPQAVNPVTGAITGWSPPQERVLKYKKLLPNIGAVYDFTSNISGFVSYAKNISVPSTDNLYNAFFFPVGTEGAKPNPETTDTFDSGLRYRSSRIQAQLSGWYTKFNDRLASAYDPELNATVFRNLGRVDKYGIDGSVAYAPIKQLTVYAFGSLMESKIKDNIQIGGGPTFDCDSADPSSPTSIRNCAFTAGKFEAGSAKYSYGFSALGSMGPVDLGITAKRTGPRYIFDNNEPIFGSGDIDCPTPVPTPACPAGAVPPSVVFPAKAPAYWLVNLDARWNMKFNGLKDTYFQLNVYNLFDETYVGSYTAGLNQSVSSAGVYGSPPFAQIGAPRTISGTINIGW
jgi:iron complex outermembrane receptor protein